MTEEKKYLLHIWLTKEQVAILNKMATAYLEFRSIDTVERELDDAIYALWDEANSTRATEKDGRVVGGNF